MVPQIFHIGFWSNSLYTFIVLMLFSLRVLLNDCRRWGWSLRPSNFLMLVGSGFFMYTWPGHWLDLKWSDWFVAVSAISFGLAYVMHRWENQAFGDLDEYAREEERARSGLDELSWEPQISIGSSYNSTAKSAPVGGPKSPDVYWLLW